MHVPAYVLLSTETRFRIKRNPSICLCMCVCVCVCMCVCVCVCMCVWHLSKSISRRFTRSIPAPDWNQDTCKDLKANLLSDMHAECGSSVTSWRYTLYSYLRQRKRSRLPTVCLVHDALKKMCEQEGDGGGCVLTQTVAGQKPLLEYTALLFTTCIIRDGVQFQFRHLRR